MLFGSKKEENEHLILLGTLVINSNFLLELYLLSLFYKEVCLLLELYRKKTQTITIYWSCLLHNHVDMSSKLK